MRGAACPGMWQVGPFAEEARRRTYSHLSGFPDDHFQATLVVVRTIMHARRVHRFLALTLGGLGSGVLVRDNCLAVVFATHPTSRPEQI
jgi:hypothetical protein